MVGGGGGGCVKLLISEVIKLTSLLKMNSLNLLTILQLHAENNLAKTPAGYSALTLTGAPMFFFS